MQREVSARSGEPVGTGGTRRCERLGCRETLFPEQQEKHNSSDTCHHLSPRRQIITPTRQNPLCAGGARPACRAQSSRMQPMAFAERARSHTLAERGAHVHALCVDTAPDNRGGALPAREGLYCGGGPCSPHPGPPPTHPSTPCASPPLQAHQPTTLRLGLRVLGRVLSACREARLPRGKPGCVLSDRPGSEP